MLGSSLTYLLSKKENKTQKDPNKSLIRKK